MNRNILDLSGNLHERKNPFWFNKKLYVIEGRIFAKHTVGTDFCFAPFVACCSYMFQSQKKRSWNLQGSICGYADYLRPEWRNPEGYWTGLLYVRNRTVKNAVRQMLN